MPDLATFCPTRPSPPRTPPGFPETIQKKGESKEDFENILNDDLNEMKKVDISSKFMTPEQEAFLEQFLEIVLGTRLGIS